MINTLHASPDALAWNGDTLPDDNVPVNLLAADDRGEYIIPFPCHFDGEDWINSHTGELLRCELIGWRPLPQQAVKKAENQD